MTLSDKIITLAALDMPPAMILDELDHQHSRNTIAVSMSALRKKGVLAHAWENVETAPRGACARPQAAESGAA